MNRPLRFMSLVLASSVSFSSLMNTIHAEHKYPWITKKRAGYAASGLVTIGTIGIVVSLYKTYKEYRHLQDRLNEARKAHSSVFLTQRDQWVLAQRIEEVEKRYKTLCKAAIAGGVLTTLGAIGSYVLFSSTPHAQAEAKPHTDDAVNLPITGDKTAFKQKKAPVVQPLDDKKNTTQTEHKARGDSLDTLVIQPSPEQQSPGHQEAFKTNHHSTSQDDKEKDITDLAQDVHNQTMEFPPSPESIYSATDSIIEEGTKALLEECASSIEESGYQTEIYPVKYVLGKVLGEGSCTLTTKKLEEKGFLTGYAEHYSHICFKKEGYHFIPKQGEHASAHYTYNAGFGLVEESQECDQDSSSRVVCSVPEKNMKVVSHLATHATYATARGRAAEEEEQCQLEIDADSNTCLLLLSSPSIQEIDANVQQSFHDAVQSISSAEIKEKLLTQGVEHLKAFVYQAEGKACIWSIPAVRLTPASELGIEGEMEQWYILTSQGFTEKVSPEDIISLGDERVETPEELVRSLCFTALERDAQHQVTVACIPPLRVSHNDDQTIV